MISSSQRPLPNNTQHAQKKKIHAPGGIRTHNPSQRAATDVRLRPRGLWDRRIAVFIVTKRVTVKTAYCDMKYVGVSKSSQTVSHRPPTDGTT